MYGSNTKKGTYHIKNWKKYLGVKEPRFLSSYEYHTYRWCDHSPAVVKWSVENVVVSYFDPVKQKQRRYIVDLYLEVMDKDGKLTKYLCEIKPSSFTKKPTKGKKKKAIYESECLQYMTNLAKWQYAEKYAKERGWKFIILTERDIFKG